MGVSRSTLSGERAHLSTRFGLCALIVSLLVSLLGCERQAVPPFWEPPSSPLLQQLLDRQAAAVLRGDESAYLETVDPAAREYRAQQRRTFANLRQLPLAQWSYQVTQVRPRAAGTRLPHTEEPWVELVARLSYRLKDYDEGVRTAIQAWSLVVRDGRWYRAAERPSTSREVWEQGPLEVVTGRHSLVLGVGRPRAELRRLAREADRAVPQVNALWPADWRRRVVVLAPADLTGTAELLSAAPAQYRGIAAVTTSEQGQGPAADRVVVNPGPYGTLGAAGRQVVMTHEAAHVATRRHTTPATPMWLSEGLADWIGYRGSDRELPDAAPQLRRAVWDGRLPDRLPRDAAFAFDAPPDQLAGSYEAGWLACLMIAQHWDERRLLKFYVAASRGGPGALDRALREVLGVSEEEFHQRWRAYVRHKLG